MQEIVEKVPWVSIVVLALVAIGGADLLIDGVLSNDYEKYVETVAWIVGPLAVGRGLQARRGR